MTSKKVFSQPRSEGRKHYMFPKGTTWVAPWYKILLAKTFGKKIHYFSVEGEIKGYFWRDCFYMTELVAPKKTTITGYAVTKCFLEEAKELSLVTVYKEEEPCSHPGCLSHITHPCEGCGRVAGKGIISLPTYLVEDWKRQNQMKWNIEPKSENKLV